MEASRVAFKQVIGTQQKAIVFNNEVTIINLSGRVENLTNKSLYTDGFSLLLLINGVIDLNINSVDYYVSSKAFLDIVDIHTVNRICSSDDFRGIYITLSHDFISEFMRDAKRLPGSNFLSRLKNPVMELKESDATIIEQRLLNVVENIGRTDHLYHRDIIKSELRTLFLELSNIIVKNSNVAATTKYRNKEDIIGRFIIMVNQNCRQQHSVSFYARELCVQAKYLSRILKTLNGKTANQFIDQVIMTEAKMLLKDPELSIQQVADLLNFSDQSAFGKFFKRHCHVSPISYRRL